MDIRAILVDNYGQMCQNVSQDRDAHYGGHNLSQQ